MSTKAHPHQYKSSLPSPLCLPTSASCSELGPGSPPRTQLLLGPVSEGCLLFRTTRMMWAWSPPPPPPPPQQGILPSPPALKRPTGPQCHWWATLTASRLFFLKTRQQLAPSCGHRWPLAATTPLEEFFNLSSSSISRRTPTQEPQFLVVSLCNEWWSFRSSDDLILWPPQLLRPMVTAKKTSVTQSSLSVKHPTLRPPPLFPTSVPGAWTLPGLTIHWSHHVSMFLTTPHVLTFHLPSLNFTIIISLLHSSSKTPPTSSARPDLVWEARLLLRNWTHSHTNCLTLNTWPLTPRGPLMLADDETAEICSSHSITLPVEILHCSLLGFPTQPRPPAPSAQDLILLFRWENRSNLKRMPSTPTGASLHRPVLCAYPLPSLRSWWTIFHAPKIEPSTSALGPIHLTSSETFWYNSHVSLVHYQSIFLLH